MSQLEKGRVQQKGRTRGALLLAARELLNGGTEPTIGDVADRAKISRATAYRYYSAVEVLMHEAVLDGIALEIDGFQAEGGEGELSARIELLVERILDMVLRNEAMFRIYLRSTLVGAQGEKRGARRVRWIGEVLGPDRGGLSAAAAGRLTQALSVFTGIETVIALRDVCGLEDKAIREVARWSARALVSAAVQGE